MFSRVATDFGSWTIRVIYGMDLLFYDPLKNTSLLSSRSLEKTLGLSENTIL